jgi:hypothetical protein
MRRLKRLPVAFLLIALAFGRNVAAQEPSHGQLWFLYQEVPKPNLLQQYEATSKELAKLIADHHAAAPEFGFFALADTHLVYTFAIPIHSLGDIEGIDSAFGSIAKSAGVERFSDLMKRSSATIESRREWAVRESPDLSYAPAQARLRREESRFFHYDLYYVSADQEGEVDPLAKELLALYRSKGVTDGYQVFKAVLGQDLPILIVRSGARDAADYYAEDQKIEALVGAERRELRRRMLAISRRVESKDAYVRPDLSVVPEPEKATK